MINISAYFNSQTRLKHSYSTVAQSSVFQEAPYYHDLKSQPWYYSFSHPVPHGVALDCQRLCHPSTLGLSWGLSQHGKCPWDLAEACHSMESRVSFKGWWQRMAEDFTPVSLMSLSFLQYGDKCQLLHLFYPQLWETVSMLGKDVCLCRGAVRSHFSFSLGESGRSPLERER